MRELEALVGLVLAAVILAAAARRVGAPYPVFLALGGAILAFVPGAPSFIAHLGSGDPDPEEGEARQFAHSDIHRRAIEAARQAVLAMRASDEIGDDAFHQMEEELDWIEMAGGGREEAASAPSFTPPRS